MNKIIMSLLGCALCLVSTVSASAADTSTSSSDSAKWNLSGYVDGGWSIATNYQNNGSTQGFQVRDGAVALKAEFKSTYALVEIPFGSSNTTYFNGQAANLGIVAPFGIKGQAFVGQKCDSGFFWKLGQFEKIFGVEANDTKDLLFTQQGIIYQNLIPRVHTGLLIGDRFADMFEIKIYAAETTGTLASDFTGNSSVPSSTSIPNITNTNYDFGGTLGAHAGDATLQVGYRMHKNVADAANEGLFDVVAGYKLSAITINAGLDFANYPTSGSSSGFGVLGQVSDQFTDMLSAGVRFEYLSSQAGISGVNDWQLTVGPQYHATEHMVVKLDYSFNSQTPGSGASSISNNILALDGVFSI